MRVTSLGWGVKQSFRAYVEASGGTIAAAAGATRVADGTFVFPATAEGDLVLDGGALRGAGRFMGQVSFCAHGGLLSVSVIDPWVEGGPDEWTISVAETPGSARRMTIAKLGAVSEEPDGSLSIGAATTLEGMMLLGDHYPPGTVLDPVRLLGG